LQNAAAWHFVHRDQENGLFGDTQRLDSRTGATLAFHHAPAESTARGIIVVCHGLAEHSRRYGRFAELMARRGYHVYAHDHRGHGETRAADAPLGRLARRDGAGRVIEDTIVMRDHAVASHRGLPVILFGHSMGGLVCLKAVIAAPRKFDAVAVWNANFHPGMAGRLAQVILKTERMLKGSDVPSAVLPKLTFGTWAKSVPDRRTDFDWLSHDAAEIDRYIADPLCGFDVSVSLWLDIFDLTFAGLQKAGLDRLSRELPVHLVGGGQDPVTDGGKAVIMLANHLKQRGFLRITAKIESEMRHETLNEIGADRAIAAFADWCDQTTAAPLNR
jgi:alpha-beta hydrolase superfamily lysophospholipase